jgi:hypothetical protein
VRKNYPELVWVERGWGRENAMQSQVLVDRRSTIGTARIRYFEGSTGYVPLLLVVPDPEKSKKKANSDGR